ncbi:MAG: M17 family metallopeptidase [Candidatus Caenarcaniphilales bacterium]|nr:M17 family metallopeptidase [Candidatus Caenarcaniphilales bacterium]
MKEQKDISIWKLTLTDKFRYGQLKISIEGGKKVLEVGKGQNKLSFQRLRKLLNKVFIFLKDQAPLKLEHDLESETGYDRDSIAIALDISSYRFEECKSESSAPITLPQLSKKAGIITQAVRNARLLIDRPADIVTPAYLANYALQLAKNNPKLKVKIHDLQACRKIGLEAFLAVAQASSSLPYMIELEYTHPNAQKKEKLGLLGKGLTYDTGGLSLKPNNYMYGMKSDMSGAAIVLGVMEGVAYLDLPLNLQSLILACENSFSDNSYRPGDILKSLSGKTIEVVDTDAEGRLTLADGLTYLSRHVEIKGIIDYATLTGSVAYALGGTAAGGFSNDRALIETFQRSSEEIGELVWEFPLLDDYKEDLESSVADLLQCDGRPDGIIAALFLKEFLMRDLPWLHLDIAGTAYLDEPTDYALSGATGWGVWSTLNYLMKNSTRN